MPRWCRWSRVKTDPHATQSSRKRVANSAAVGRVPGEPLLLLEAGQMSPMDFRVCGDRHEVHQGDYWRYEPVGLRLSSLSYRFSLYGLVGSIRTPVSSCRVLPTSATFSLIPRPIAAVRPPSALWKRGLRAGLVRFFAMMLAGLQVARTMWASETVEGFRRPRELWRSLPPTCSALVSCAYTRRTVSGATAGPMFDHVDG